jgi:predicted  nucleic acid-binding Zn-ribbon protein
MISRANKYRVTPEELQKAKAENEELRKQLADANAKLGNMDQAVSIAAMVMDR